jgi:hypothetical protein
MDAACGEGWEVEVEVVRRVVACGMDVAWGEGWEAEAAALVPIP